MAGDGYEEQCDQGASVGTAVILWGYERLGAHICHGYGDDGSRYDHIRGIPETVHPVNRHVGNKRLKDM